MKYTFRGTHFPAEPHYTDSTVAVFIPEVFKPKNRADLVFYFHGWYTSVQKAPPRLGGFGRTQRRLPGAYCVEISA